MLTYTLFLIGFFLLIKGADWLVDGASSIAKRLKVSDLVIGLTVVAFGTSAPEFFVNLFAALEGTTDLAIGNIVGSNIANILLILGVAGLIYPLTVSKGTVWKEIPLSLLAALLMLVMANDVLLDGVAADAMTRTDGLVLIGFFAVFLYYTFGIARATGTDEDAETRPRSLGQSALMVLGGLAGLVLGGQWIVEGAKTIAAAFGLSEALIGLTIVSVGTSLPELATSVVAAIKRKSDIVIGNVVGSNIFNIFWILGVTAIVRPLPIAPMMNFDLLVLVAASLLLFFWMFVGRKHSLERWQSGLFLAGYAAYVVFLVARG